MFRPSSINSSLRGLTPKTPLNFAIPLIKKVSSTSKVKSGEYLIPSSVLSEGIVPQASTVVKAEVQQPAPEKNVSSSQKKISSPVLTRTKSAKKEEETKLAKSKTKSKPKKSSKKAEEPDRRDSELKLTKRTSSRQKPIANRKERFRKQNPNKSSRWGKKDDVELYKVFKQMAPDLGKE